MSRTKIGDAGARFASGAYGGFGFAVPAHPLSARVARPERSQAAPASRSPVPLTFRESGDYGQAKVVGAR